MSNKNTLLDDYLSNTEEHALTGEELDRQLFEATPPRQQGRSTSPTTEKRETVEDVFDNAFAAIVDKQAQAESIDTAVKAASHGVKVLAPLMLALGRWIDPNADQASIDRTMGQVLNRVRGDAETVIKSYGVTADDAPAWLMSQVCGQLMEVLISAIDRNNGTMLKANDQRYLAPLLNMAQQASSISSSPYAYPSDPKWSLINTLMTASAEVMTAYQNFTYFHEDPATVSQFITDFLNERVIEGTLADLTARWGLSESEQGHLGASLLRQAGRILATCWTDNVVETLQSIKELPKDARREAMVGGYPLTAVIDAFERTFQGVEVSAVGALRSMAPMREVRLSPSSASSPVYG